tara:strand:+ start:1033 stop:2868 length:1836 start_codon:yes stop_codon:yes gene_type:complete
MAKLLKLRRGTTTQHGSFTGAEGEVTVDTDKETLVVHDGSTAGGHPVAAEDMANVSSASIAGRLSNDSIATSKIAAGALPSDVTVTNANVVSNAAIAGTKVSPDFGSQNISTTGTIGSSNITITNTQPFISLQDSDNENDFEVGNAGGTFRVRDVDAGVNRLTIDSSGTAGFSGNLDVGAGIDVTGNATVSGNLSSGDITISDVSPSITFTDSNDNPDFSIFANTGELKFNDVTNSTVRMKIESNGTVDVSGNLDVGAGVDVTGNITTTGDITVQNDNPAIRLTDTNNDDDFSIRGSSGMLRIRSETDGADRLIVNSDGHVDIGGNLDVGAGVDVTGNITVTGTVDGVDIAARDALFGNLTTSNGVLNNGVSATTQSAGDNSTKVATTAYTDTAISNLVDSSPGALNTLNELAAAINDDANFSTTVTNNIATKMPLSGGTFTGNVTSQKIVPANDSQFDLGSNSVRFANVYADNFVGSGANLTGVESFVSGMIILWSGAQNAIPSGFVLCDGTNSTPDLRNRFVVGAGDSYSVGATGGSVTASDTLNLSVTISGTTGGSSSNGSTRDNGGYYIYPALNNHTHSFSGSWTGSETITVDTRSPYYALCYIMKT